MAAIAETSLSESEGTVIVNKTISRPHYSNIRHEPIVLPKPLEEDSAFYDDASIRCQLQAPEDNDRQDEIPEQPNEPIYDDNLKSKQNLSMTTYNEDATFPELTPQHLLTVFFDSDITTGIVGSLGLLLGIGRGRLLSSQSEQVMYTPARQAMEVIIAWVDQNPEIPLEEKHKVLANHLRTLGLNCVIPRLHGQVRYIETDLQQMTKYLANASKSFSREQAYKFGHTLKLSNDKIDAISQRTGATRGMDLVLQIFDYTNKRNTHLRKSVVDSVHESLLEASNTLYKDDDVKRIIATDSQIGSDYTDSGTATENTIAAAGKRLKKVTCFKFLCGMTLVVAILLIIITLCAIENLIIFPHFISLPKQVIVPSDVVLYTIPSSYWINTISIELEGTDSCSADVISVKCNDVQYFNDPVIKFIDEFDYLYINKNSSIQFILSTETDSAIPYYAWIFTDLQSAIQHSANNFEDLACTDTPDGVWCIRLSENKRFVTPSSSYYFIRCEGDPNCTLVDLIEVSTREFDLKSTRMTYKIHNVTIHTYSDKQVLKVKNHPFNPFPVEGGTCLLMNLTSDNCINPIYNVAFIVKAGRYELLLYLGLVLLVWIVLLVFAIIVCRRTVRKYNTN